LVVSFRRVPAAIVVALSALALDRPERVFSQPSQIPSERRTGPTVDFIALDADGDFIPDLQPSEIEIRIADRVRTVRALRWISSSRAPASTGARVPPPYGTNDDVAVSRRFMLVIDQESFTAGREQLFRDAIAGLVAEFSPADRAMVAALPFGGIVMPFTADTTRIRLAAGRINGQAARGETGSDLACRTRRFLESLEGLLREQGTQNTPQTLILLPPASPLRGEMRQWDFNQACASCSSTCFVTSPRPPALHG
jgi:hypothetical protein